MRNDVPFSVPLCEDFSPFILLLSLSLSSPASLFAHQTSASTDDARKESMRVLHTKQQKAAFNSKRAKEVERGIKRAAEYAYINDLFSNQEQLHSSIPWGCFDTAELQPH